MKISEPGVLIHAFAVTNGGVAFTLANTAVGDTMLVSGLTFYMIHRLGKLYQVEDVNAKQIVSQCLAYYAAPYLTGKLLFWLPGIGNWANAATTVLLTETVGWSCVTLFSAGQRPEDLSQQEWKTVLDGAKAKAKASQAENKRLLKKMSAEERKEAKAITEQLRDEAISEEEKERLLETLTELYQRLRDR